MMNILMASDNNYVPPCMALIQSIVDNNNTEIVVWYLHTDLTDKNICRLKALSQKKTCQINFIQVEDDLFKDAPIGSHFTKEMYYRILAGELLPETVNKILYLDSDIIIKGNIEEFYNRSFVENNNKQLAIVCPDAISETKSVEYHLRLNIPMEKIYFNSGVLLLNLDMMREIVKLEEVFDYISSNHEKLYLPDQDVLNVLWQDYVIIEDELIYNLMVDSYSSTSFQKFNNAKIIHYAGSKKPWKYGYKKLGKQLFKSYAIKTGNRLWFYASIIKTMHSTIIKITKKKIKKLIHK